MSSQPHKHSTKADKYNITDIMGKKKVKKFIGKNHGHLIPSHLTTHDSTLLKNKQTNYHLHILRSRNKSWRDKPHHYFEGRVFKILLKLVNFSNT